MELDPEVRIEWSEQHVLSRRSLAWLHEHADPGDPHPILTAIALLREESRPTPWLRPLSAGSDRPPCG